MAEQKPAAARPKTSAPNPAPAAPVQAAPAKAAAAAEPVTSLSGLTPEQAKEFHEQFKVTYTAFVGIAALVHLFLIATKPWF
jgi:predicted flap endonuclease-1-like 5' DNA nuclease